MTVPRILHHIWIGPRPVPDKWVAAWRSMHPEWDYRLWREADLRAMKMRLAKQYRQSLAAECWHGAADIARLEILRVHGGVYVDIDSRPLMSLTNAPFMDASVFAGYEPTPSLPGRVANGTIGAEPHAPAIDTAIDLIAKMPTLDPPWDTTGGTVLTAALLVHRRCCDVRVLPSRTFYATDASGRPVAGKERPYVEHFWSTTNSTYPPRDVVLVPRRAGDPHRERAWSFVKDWWESHGWRVVEGHHDEGLFNAAKARNLAARLAGDEWEVAIFADADTVPGDAEVIRQAVTMAKARNHFVRPFRRYWMLDERASDAWLSTGQRPSDGARPLGEAAHGGIHIVPRALHEAVRGYDERFVGWGWEDTSYEMACRALGGFSQLPGDVYHLWHPHQPRDPSTPEYRANVALGKKYMAARNRRSMTALLTERDGVQPTHTAPTFGLLLVTNGRRDELERTLASIERHISPLTSTLVCDDSGDRRFADWLRERLPDARIDAHAHLGHGKAVHRALRQATRLPAEWVFVVEEDMEFQRDIDLRDIAAVMDEHPNVCQMVLRRQAWFPLEVEAGGMIERFDPAAFTEHETAGFPWLSHRLFYSMNPHLVRRSFIARQPWPPVPNSEHHFALRLFKDPAHRSGLWGPREMPEPWVMHVGATRTGTGY